MSGDLSKALRALETSRTEHAGLYVAVERARLILVGGRFEEKLYAAESEKSLMTQFNNNCVSATRHSTINYTRS